VMITTIGQQMRRAQRSPVSESRFSLLLGAAD
jgi:hypothetical protein